MLRATSHFRFANSLLLCSIATWATDAAAQPAPAMPREIVAGLTTTRVVQGKPYELAGKRIVFTNWYYIQPGDLDWRDDDGKSVYVHGNKGKYDAHHVSIVAPRGIRIMAEKPQVMGPFERPHRMVMQNGKLYRGWTDSDYYESKDAVHWDRKAKLVFDATIRDGLYQIFIDPTAPSETRYKSVFTTSLPREQFDAFRAKRPDGWEPRAALHLAENNEVECLRGAVSPDGIHWTTLPDPLVVEYSDTLNTAYYDPVLAEYVIYTRYWSVGPTSTRIAPNIRNNWTGVGRRAIGRTASRDFSKFLPSEQLLEPTPDMLPSEQLYTNCHTTIPGAPDQHLMIPAIWNASIDDTTRLKLAASHDGKTWHWVPGGDLLQTPSFGRWDGGCIWALPELIELPSGDWALPYLGHNLPHKYPRGQQVGGLGYAVWPKGRMVAVEAEDLGEFTMIPVVAAGKKLKINASTSRTGWVKVGVVGSNGRTLEDCAPMIGDQHWTTVTWKAGDALDVKSDNAVVTLRVELKQAKLFGLEFD